ncbi:restriction endonuclease subunit R [Candidatus Pacearchaeota archaeon]|nr:restriction endonuclease subunit R [Candidatus Pacearchaeota archaeon]
MVYSLKPEDKARHEKINPLLEECGWEIQNYHDANPNSAKGVAVEYFPMGMVGEADYVLFVNGKAIGIIEAKKLSEGALISKEPQAEKYSKGFPEDFKKVDEVLPFAYIATGSKFKFINYWDPKPRSRDVKAFHRPEYFEELIKKGKENNLRRKLAENKPYEHPNLWSAQKKAIDNIKESLALNHPRALIQMATGSGKTYTAVNLAYDLKKNCKAKRILFLVDRGNLGDNAYDEFDVFNVPKDGRKFTDIYNVQHLKTNKIGSSNDIVVSTIQRMYSILKGEKEADVDEEGEVIIDPMKLKESMKYNKKLPIEEFDFIVIDECHRSIYGEWKQVLDYFDAFLIGITATPSSHTISFFDQNLVMEYGHKEAVMDNVNLDFEVYDIKTKITGEGGNIPKGINLSKINMRTKEETWAKTEDEISYVASELDKKVTSRDQIRTLIKTFKDKFLREAFPEREHVPKTLIFAKDDAHAERIVEVVREEFAEGSDFCKKITYKTEGKKPKELIREFRNELPFRIAVTVDMIATGTDIKPLEIVFFMRSVKSRQYFEQMKGRGVRVMKNNEDFRAVNPGAYAKEKFFIVDALGICKNKELSDTEPIDRVGITFDRLLRYFQFGKPKKEHIESMASRLNRLSKKLRKDQSEEIKAIYGKGLNEIAKDLIESVDNDEVLSEAREKFGKDVKEEKVLEVLDGRIEEMKNEFMGNSAFVKRLQEIRKEVEQIVDDYSKDTVLTAGFSMQSKEDAKEVVKSFKEFIEENKDRLAALQVYYNGGQMKWKDLKTLVDKIRAPPYGLTDSKLWGAYKLLEGDKVYPLKNKDKKVNFVSLLRHEIEKTKELEPYLDTVEKRFNEWLGIQKENGVEFSEGELVWLEKLKDVIATSVEVEMDDFSQGELMRMGGIGKASKVFGKERLEKIVEEMNVEVGG